ncbi:PTS N-acetylglucosamine transporter subunit IIBC [Aerococcaceae bacterium 50-4]
MKKIIIASHHNLASGFKDTINYIVPDSVEILDINAYVEQEEIETEIVSKLNNFSHTEQIFVFTDLLGGSVNQEFVKYLNEYNIELITGINLPLIMTIVLSMAEDSNLSKEHIRSIIEEAKAQIIYVNDYLEDQGLDEDDE